MISSPSLTLYRQLMRQAKNMNDYNFRSYAMRRVKVGFESNRSLIGEEANIAFAEGKRELETLKRQAIIGNLYPSGKNVLQ